MRVSKYCFFIWVSIWCHISVVAVSASIVPPPDPNSSCASAEYAAQKAGQTSSLASDDTPMLMVVAGSAERHLNTTQWIRMGREVTVCVMGLHNWIYKQKKNPSNLRLVIGGYLLANIQPNSISPSGQEYLNFVLQMDTADSEDWKAWAAIVDGSRHSHNQLLITIGTTDKQVFESAAVVTVEPYPTYWIGLLAALLLLLGALIYLSAKTDLLRYVVGQRPPAPQRPPFSLGLVQMAFWFYLVVAAYVYICVCTLQPHIPMGSVLGLLGISSTTGLAAIYVDKQKEASSQSQRNDLLAEQAALKSRLAELSSNSITPGSTAEGELAQKNSRLAGVEAAISQLPPATRPATSHGFVQDVLNDGDSISFHRFQIAIWTIVLGAVFIWAVYRNISMPEFDASLLTLMGISSGTYVGFKFPEKPK
ncbi:MAG: hypothetical protein WCA13_09720 [Terriglobales bacterium]